MLVQSFIFIQLMALTPIIHVLIIFISINIEFTWFKLWGKSEGTMSIYVFIAAQILSWMQHTYNIGNTMPHLVHFILAIHTTNFTHKQDHEKYNYTVRRIYICKKYIIEPGWNRYHKQISLWYTCTDGYSSSHSLALHNSPSIVVRDENLVTGLFCDGVSEFQRVKPDFVNSTSSVYNPRISSVNL